MLCTVFALAAGMTSAQEERSNSPSGRIEPISIGFKLEERVSIVLFDVEVEGHEGNPLPGLTRDDFEVRVDRKWVIPSSVDDLCGCAAERPAGEVGLDDALADALIAAKKTDFVFYLDFSHLQTDGRIRALQQVERWIREVMQADERVMIVGFTLRGGLFEIAPFTDDRNELLASLGAIERGALSSTFAEGLQGDLTCRHCADRVLTRYFASQRALKSLRFFLQGLTPEGRRRALFFFHQNHVLRPSRLFGSAASLIAYSFVERWDAFDTRYQAMPQSGVNFMGRRPNSTLTTKRMPDHLRLVEAISGEAVTSQTTIYPVYCGDGGSRLAVQAVNFGANLADFTGGAYNRSAQGVGSLLAEAERGCRCVYRLAFAPHPSTGSGIQRLKVAVKGEALPDSYRVSLLSERDRFIRRARSVLARPEIATEVHVTTAIIPVRRTGKVWEIRTEVGLDVDTLTQLSSGPIPRGNWIVGAILSRQRGGDQVMTGFGQLRTDDDEPIRETIVHEQSFNVDPGVYALRAFVNDRWANSMGGAKSSIRLPGRRQSGIVGPVALRRVGEHIRLPLPLSQIKRKKRKSSDSDSLKVTQMETGAVPYGGEPLVRGETMGLHSWVCYSSKIKTPAPVVRFVTRGEAGLFRFPDSRQELRDGCLEFVDLLDTMDLPAGVYRYHVQTLGDSDQGDDPMYGFVDFAVIATDQLASAPSGEDRHTP